MVVNDDVFGRLPALREIDAAGPQDRASRLQVEMFGQIAVHGDGIDLLLRTFDRLAEALLHRAHGRDIAVIVQLRRLLAVPNRDVAVVQPEDLLFAMQTIARAMDLRARSEKQRLGDLRIGRHDLCREHLPREGNRPLHVVEDAGEAECPAFAQPVRHEGADALLANQ